MKVIEQKKHILMSEEMETTAFGIDEENLAGIFQVLRSSLYSDPVYAVLREYGTNAVDAHIDAGHPEKPFLVKLPTRFNPTLHIRDFGIGLTHQQINEIYSMYGKSTKTNSNEQTGQLGLGSKSGFSYGDSFQIRSFVNGEVTNYDAFIDESLIGKIARLPVVEKTDEPNGIEIVIAVKPEDVKAFQQRASQTFAYFKVAPEIRNLDQEHKFVRPRAFITGNGWRLIGSQQDSVVIMGNIAYPLVADSIPNLDEAHQDLIEAGIEIDFPIGDLQMSASREALQYTTYTRKQLKKRFDDILAELGEVVTNNVKQAETLWEAKIIYRTALNSLGRLSNTLASKLRGQLFWNDIAVNSESFDYVDAESHGVSITAYYKQWDSQKKFKINRNIDKILASHQHVVMINDGRSSFGLSAKVGEYYAKHKPEMIYVIKFADDTAKAKYYKEVSFDTVPVVSMESLPKPVVIGVPGAPGTVVSNVKHTLKCFIFNRKSSSYSGTFSHDWDNVIVDLDNGAGVWVTLDRFQVTQPNVRDGLSPYHFQKLLDVLKIANIKVPQQIFGFKPAAIENKTLGKGWVTLWDYVKAEVDKELKSKNLLQVAADLREYRRHDTIKFAPLIPEYNKLGYKDKPMGVYLHALMSMKQDDQIVKQVSSIMEVQTEFKLTFGEVEPTFNLTALRDKVNTTYPLFNMLSSYDMRQAVVAGLEYVMLKDATL